MTATKKINVKDFLINNGIIVVLILLAIITAIRQPSFGSFDNFKNIALNVAPRFIIACGVSGCLITRGTDLSAGRMVGLSACLAGTLLQKPDYSGKFFPNLPDFGVWWVVVVLLICVAVCAIFGLINGMVVSFLQVPAFIGTLGMQLIVYGVCLVYTNATPIGGYRSAYTEVAKGRLFGAIPYLFLIALAVGFVIWFIYNKTPHGKYMYAIGGNEQAAEVSGVNTKKTKIIIYVTAAALYALGGFLVGAKSGGSSVNMGMGWELEAIAACTIGGVSVNGGIGRVSGVLIGVLVFEILKTCLQYLGVDTNYQYIAQGIVIVVAIALDIRKYIAKK
ncbi:MAG: beta-methylgalactoside transporter [Lacrimispora sp.]|uniref:galactose/methyl galactoside ABC transporter permease MglC n=1 Tax=Lacrimispora sp. TaxID=2719234 RepID=UPI0039E5726C